MASDTWVKRDLRKGSFPQQWVRLRPLNLFSFKVYSSVSCWLADWLLLWAQPIRNVIVECHRFIFSFHLFDTFFLRWRRKFKVFLNNQQKRIGILQIVKPFFSLCLLKRFLNNGLVSNTLLTEIDKPYRYFPLTLYYTMSSKLVYRLRCI